MSVKKQIHLALDTGNDSFAPTLHHVYLYLKSTAITILTTIVSTYCMLKYYIPPCKIYPWIMDWRENNEAISQLENSIFNISQIKLIFDRNTITISIKPKVDN